MMLKKTLALTLLLGVLPVLGHATGNHFGWCNGKNNPHQSAGCSVSGGASGGTAWPGAVPITNQLPAGGTIATPIQSPAVITLRPIQPTVITGFGPVPTLQGQTAPPVTGTGQAPILVMPVPQPVLTGVGPVPQPQVLQAPSFTGTGKLPVVVQPLAPVTFTGTGPVPSIQAIPSPSFTGQGLPSIIVVPQPPVTISGYAPVSAAIIVRPSSSGGFTGIGAVPVPRPNARPNAVPTAVPNPVPQAVPPLAPGRITAPPTGGGAQYTMVQRPKPRPVGKTNATGGGSITHHPQPQAASVGHGLVTRNAGRQAAHDAAQFTTGDGAARWSCLASGHGKRLTRTGRGAEPSGAFRHVGAVDVMGRDLPAVHPRHSGCLVAVKRRGTATR
jgi:hypothetical protein